MFIGCEKSNDPSRFDIGVSESGKEIIVLPVDNTAFITIPSKSTITDRSPIIIASRFTVKLPRKGCVAKKDFNNVSAINTLDIIGRFLIDNNPQPHQSGALKSAIKAAKSAQTKNTLLGRKPIDARLN